LSILLGQTPAEAAETFVAADGNLQAALDAAAPGDTIVLQAGATFTGSFTVKRSVTIRTEPRAELPPPGVRTGPERSPWLAKLQSTSNNGALIVPTGVSYVTVENIEVLPNTLGTGTAIELGFGDSRQTSVAQAPHHIVLDRILVLVPEGQALKRIVALNSADTVIKNSYLYGAKYAGADSQAIGGWNGPGPHVIENNRLAAAGEDVMWGGADPNIPGLVPTGIRFVRNHVGKPWSWKGSSWTIKNNFELKNAQDVLVEGNLFEYSWLAAQTGVSIVLTPRNQSGGNPDTVVQRVVFRSNIVRHVSAGITIMGDDNNHVTRLTNDILIENNLFEDIDWSAYGGTGRIVMIDRGGDNIRIRNNTSPHNDGHIVYFSSMTPVTGFVLENNLVDHGNYGIHGEQTVQGEATLSTHAPGAIVLNNVFVENPARWLYPAGNYYPATWGDVQLADDYRLAATSPYAGTGAGADIDAILAAIDGSAVPPPPPPEEVCGDGLDNDGDGQVDEGCAVEVPPPPEEICGDGLDNDGDGQVDEGCVVEPPPAPCSFTVSPTSISVSSQSQTAFVSVERSAPDCSFAATSNAAWITFSSGTDGVTLSVQANTARGTRTGSVTVAGTDVTITQQGTKRGKGRPAKLR
jgi:hypothetical protein